MRDNLVYKAPFEGSCCRERLSGERHLLGSSLADGLLKELRHSPPRVDADFRVTVYEEGSLRGDQEIAVQRYLESPRDRMAIDRPYDGLLAGADDVKEMDPGLFREEALRLEEKMWAKLES